MYIKYAIKSIMEDLNISKMTAVGLLKELQGIGNDIVRIIVKVLILAVIIVIEFTIWANATLPWLESKTYKPTIRKVED